MLKDEDIKALRERLNSPNANQPLSEEELELLLNTLYDLGTQENLLSKLAEHYGTPYKRLQDLLLARQLIYLHLNTDYSKQETEVDVQAKLANQQSSLKALITKLTGMLSKLEEALVSTNFIRGEAVRILALYKARYLKDAPPDTTNKS